MHSFLSAFTDMDVSHESWISIQISLMWEQGTPLNMEV